MDQSALSYCQQRQLPNISHSCQTQCPGSRLCARWVCPQDGLSPPPTVYRSGPLTQWLSEYCCSWILHSRSHYDDQSMCRAVYGWQRRYKCTVCMQIRLIPTPSWNDNCRPELALFACSTYFPFSVSQTATVLSNDPVRMWLPVVLKLAHITSAEWPWNTERINVCRVISCCEV